MIRETSIQAYREIQDSGRLSQLQILVYRTLFQHGPLSRTETAHKIVGAARDGVHQRFCELKNAGLIKIVGKRKCSITGKTVRVWDVTSHVPTDSDFKPKLAWPFSYYVVVEPTGDGNEWVYFTGENAKSDAIAHNNNLTKPGKIMELKGRMMPT